MNSRCTLLYSTPFVQFSSDFGSWSVSFKSTWLYINRWLLGTHKQLIPTISVLYPAYGQHSRFINIKRPPSLSSRDKGGNSIRPIKQDTPKPMISVIMPKIFLIWETFTVYCLPVCVSHKFNSLCLCMIKNTFMVYNHMV